MLTSFRARVHYTWTVLTRLGLDDAPPDEARVVPAANQFYVLASIASIPWIVTLAVLGGPTPAPAATHTAMVLAWMAGLVLNRLGMSLLASTLALAAPIFQYVYLADVYSRSAGFHLTLLAMPALAFVMIPSRRWPLRLVFVGSATVALLLVSLAEPFRTAEASVTGATIRGLAVANIVTVVATLTIVAAFNHHYLDRERRRTRALLTEAQRAAHTDSLTECLNRRGIAPIVADAMRRGPYALGLVDLDRFKRINDVLGHSAGDLVLANVARTMTEAIGDRGSVARWGGEEFLVVLPGFSLVDAIAVVDQVRVAVEDDYADGGLPEPVTISAGVAHGSRLTGRDQLLRLADAKLYEAKAAGRNVVLGAAIGDQARV